MPKHLIVTATMVLIAACAAPAATPSSTPPASLSPTATAATPTPTASPTTTASPSPTQTAAASAPPTATSTVAPTLGPTTAPAGWTEVADFPTGGLESHVTGIAYGDGLFVAVGWSPGTGGAFGRFWTSPDGMNWTATVGQGGKASLQAVTYSGTDFYAFTSAPTTVWRSTDGLTWQQVDLPESGGELGTFNAFTGGSVLDAASSGGQIYAAGDATLTGGDIACTCVSAWRSTNGTDWTQSIAVQDDSFRAFAALPGLALVITNGANVGRAMRISSDFDTWTAPAVDLPETASYLDAAADGQRIVAVGQARLQIGIPTALVTEGATWSFVSIDRTAEAPAEQVASAGGRFVAVGTEIGGDRIVALSWSSMDGLAWAPGPEVYDLPRPLPGSGPSDDTIQHRTIGGGDPGFVLAQTFDDGLHMWFAPAEAFAPGL